MNIAKANSIDLAWDHFGREADPPILLIAGLGVQMIRWADPFCEDLAARGFRVIRFDPRSCLPTPHTATGWRCPRPSCRARWSMPSPKG
ncbi:alpha/beta fold hydrolase [Roseixanthobacter psychrophilus]|uniref:alpha/beta fold hydrolase n=1 Tax=Roseixanthobacter psychrophilus TaxID=3119917 RepID=UPI003D1C9FFF